MHLKSAGGVYICHFEVLKSNSLFNISRTTGESFFTDIALNPIVRKRKTKMS